MVFPVELLPKRPAKMMAVYKVQFTNKEYKIRIVRPRLFITSSLIEQAKFLGFTYQYQPLAINFLVIMKSYIFYTLDNIIKSTRNIRKFKIGYSLKIT